MFDFALGPDAEEFRAEARAFLDEHLTAEVEERMYRSGVAHDPDFTAALIDRGWLVPGWPVAMGGQGRSAFEVMAFHEEFQQAAAPMIGTGTTMMVSRLIHHLGTDEQKREILPAAGRGEIIIVLGFTEPESGSDVAAASCRAVRDGDEWVIDGQKMFTTNAHIADYVFLLTRTRTDAPKHKGLTMFLVPMKQPGIEVQAVYTLSGERTNITYLSAVRVPDSIRVGGVDEGWSVLTHSLQDEHSGGFGGDSARLLAHAEGSARDSGRLAEPAVREALARTAAEIEVAQLLMRRATWMMQEGEVPIAEGPMSKLYSTERLVRQSEELAETMGPDGLRSYLSPGAPEQGHVEHARRFAVGTTIYAGTSEIQRGIIAQRGLGLPRQELPR